MLSVEDIVRRELLGGRSVALPFVGTLSTFHIAAQIDGSMAIAPYRSLVLDETFDEHRSLIWLIADELAQADYDMGVKFYNSWLSSCSDHETLVIEGVCQITLSDFTLTVDYAFHTLLRPSGSEPVSIGRRAKKKPLRTGIKTKKQEKSRVGFGLILALLIVMAAAIYIGHYFYTNH